MFFSFRGGAGIVHSFLGQTSCSEWGERSSWVPTNQPGPRGKRSSMSLPHPQTIASVGCNKSKDKGLLNMAQGRKVSRKPHLPYTNWLGRRMESGRHRTASVPPTLVAELGTASGMLPQKVFGQPWPHLPLLQRPHIIISWCKYSLWNCGVRFPFQIGVIPSLTSYMTAASQSSQAKWCCHFSTCIYSTFWSGPSIDGFLFLSKPRVIGFRCCLWAKTLAKKLLSVVYECGGCICCTTAVTPHIVKQSG